MHIRVILDFCLNWCLYRYPLFRIVIESAFCDEFDFIADHGGFLNKGK